MVDKKRIARRKSTKKTNLGDVIEEERKKCNTLHVEFNWSDVCKHIPKCVLFRADQLREIASKRLGSSSYKIVDQFLVFMFEQLINENVLTGEKFSVLQERAESLTFSDAQTMFEAIVTIRRKFSENSNANKPTESAKLTNDKPASLYGLKFNYKSRASAGSTSEIAESSLKHKNEGMEQAGATTGLKFVIEEYEKKLDEYYKNHSLAISRQKFGTAIIEILRGDDAESELADFLGLEAMQLMEYIVEHRESIVALNSDGRILTNSQEQQIWRAVLKVDRKSKKIPVELGRKKINKMTLD